MTIAQQLSTLATQGQCRDIPALQHDGRYIISAGKRLFNTAGNDYLGIASEGALAARFWAQIGGQYPALGAGASRLLTGNDEPHQQLEQALSSAYQQAALLFNSGYHANIAILPALAAADKPALILADKWVHASIIDGIRLAGCDFQRYRHNDYQHLAQCLARAGDDYARIFIVTESVFSMDGDCADLAQLVALKKSDTRIQIYLDEAHAVGVFGAGLGLAAEKNYLAEIDYLIGTFGKAFASVGAYVICAPEAREYLINRARSLIFSTNLPPLNAAWSHFVFAQRAEFAPARARLLTLSAELRAILGDKSGGETHIVPYFCGHNERALSVAKNLHAAGIYARAIRPPTVPVGTARLRFSLPATTTTAEFDHLATVLRAQTG